MLTLTEAKSELFALAKKFVGRPQVGVTHFREWVKKNPSHLMSALYVWRTCFRGSFEEGKTSPFEG